MLVFILSFFLYLVSFNAAYPIDKISDNKLLYCLDFSLPTLIEGKTSYKDCSLDKPVSYKSYFKLLFEASTISSVERYREARLVGVKNFSYSSSGRLSGIEDIVVSGAYGKRLMSYTLFRLNTDTSLSRLVRKSRINMHNARSYVITYSRKLEEYDNDELTRVSYYSSLEAAGEEKEERLLIRLYYSDERITAYKLRRYKKRFLVVEDYYGAKDSSRKFYRAGKLLLSYYYTDKKKGYYLYIYYYSSTDSLLVKEAYYVIDRNTKGLQRRIESAMFSSPLSNTTSLSDRKRFWRKLIRPFVRNEDDSLKHYNVRSSDILMDKVSYFREDSQQTGDSLFKKDQLSKIEYYIDGIIRRIEYFDLEAREDSVEHYNYLGERVFDR